LYKDNIIVIAKLLETIPLDFQMKIISDYDFYISEVKNNVTQFNSKISKQVTYDAGTDEYETPMTFDEQVQIEDLHKLEQMPKLYTRATNHPFEVKSHNALYYN